MLPSGRTLRFTSPENGLRAATIAANSRPTRCASACGMKSNGVRPSTSEGGRPSSAVTMAEQ